MVFLYDVKRNVGKIRNIYVKNIVQVFQCLCILFKHSYTYYTFKDESIIEYKIIISFLINYPCKIRRKKLSAIALIILGIGTGQVLGIGTGQILGIDTGQILGIGTGQVLGIGTGQILGIDIFQSFSIPTSVAMLPV